MAPYSRDGILGEALADLAESPALSSQAGTLAATWGASRYETIKADALSTSLWRFAIREVTGSAISPDPSGENRYTTEDWTYAYTIPANCVRFVGLKETSEYVVLHDHVYTDELDATLVYIENVGEERFPAYFAAALIEEIKCKILYTLINDSEMKKDARQEADRAWRRARSTDSKQSVTATIAGALSGVLKSPTTPR